MPLGLLAGAGVIKVAVWLASVSHAVNRKGVQRLMRLMGIEAPYPKPQMAHHI